LRSSGLGPILGLGPERNCVLGKLDAVGWLPARRCNPTLGEELLIAYRCRAPHGDFRPLLQLEGRIGTPLLRSAKVVVMTTPARPKQGEPASDNRTLVELGPRLPHRRRDFGIVQQDLAKPVGVSRSTLHTIEHGGEGVRWEKVIAVAQA